MSAGNRRGMVGRLGWRTFIDLVIVLGMTLLTLILAVRPETEGSLLQFVLGTMYVLFFPGYALVAALFPDADLSRPTQAQSTPKRLRRHNIDLVERLALALALSIAITPIVGVALGITPWGMDPVTLFGSIGAITAGLTIVAAIRRHRLRPEDRFSVRTGSALGKGTPSSKRRGILNATLGLAVISAVGSVGYAIATPQQAERYTEFQLLTEDDGELVAADYPTTFTAGEGQSLVVSIENHERETVSYTVVNQLEALDGDETVEIEELDQFSTELDHGESWQNEHTVVPDLVGEDLRLSYLLYLGDPPTEPTQENADEHLHIWIDVTRS